MKKSFVIISALALLCIASCKPKSAGMPFLDYEVLNEQAAQVYLRPGVRF